MYNFMILHLSLYPPSQSVLRVDTGWASIGQLLKKHAPNVERSFPPKRSRTVGC